MEDLINGLLDYARTSEKNQASNVDVNEMVREIAASIVPRDFRVDINKLPRLYTDSIKLEQVFTNLISNSVKYTPRAQGHIIVTCEANGDLFRFSVKDNGMGIDPEYHQKIFEIFQTLRGKNDKESTGVGLAIVKKIIEEQRGTITVNSTLGEGAEFIFTWQKNNRV
jgi:signal transduction histidine kinase